LLISLADAESARYGQAKQRRICNFGINCILGPVHVRATRHPVRQTFGTWRLRLSSIGRHLLDMAASEVVMLANRSVAFNLYEFHLEGVPAQDLAAAYSLPVERIEKCIERARLRLECQKQFSAQLTANTDSAV
jgi:hypothetical protein